MQSDQKIVIQVPVSWKAPRRKADDSVDLSFNTTVEIPVEEMAVFDSLRKSVGWLLYSENEFDPKDVPKEDAPTDEKSLSERLRNVMYAVYMETHDNGKDFSAWRKAQMEAIIDKYKEKLA